MSSEIEPIAYEYVNIYPHKHLYHMTHINNLENILDSGYLYSHNIAHSENLICFDLSNKDVNAHRSRKEPINHRPIHDYVPFYLTPRNPMLYARKDYQSDIVIMAFHKVLIFKDNVLITDGNAASRQTTFTDDRDFLFELNWECIKDEWWTSYEDGKRIRCAEVLIPDQVDISFIKSWHFLTKELKEEVEEIISDFYPKLRRPMYYNSKFFF